MIDVKCNDKENEIVKEESEKSCGLHFHYKIQVSCLFHFFLVSRVLAQIPEAVTKISLTVVKI